MNRIASRLAILTPPVLRMAALALLALLIGWFFGPVPALALLVIGFGLLLVVHMSYASRLAAWLENPRLDDIPNGWGLWTDVFTRLYRARRGTEINERRLVENEERFRRTISALPEGIVLVDASLQIDWCNPVAEQHLGIRLSADQGLRLTNLVRDPDFVSYMTSAHFESPLVLRPLNTPGTALEIRVVDFEAARSIIISRDITQRERVDAVRRDFIANVSHELRTPLTVVSGFLEMLLDTPHADEAIRRRHLELMHEQSQRMSRLVEDLLTLSRLESRENLLTDEVVDVSQLVREVGDEARVLSAGRHRIEVTAPSAFLRGSRDELRSAFGNLVSNGIRYTPAGGHIMLRWVEGDGEGRFEVEDTGIGIANEHLSRLTERFYRVDKSRSRETGGTGLGLAIVKHILLRHQARLDVASEIGKGSTFAAVFPAERMIEVAASGRVPAAAASAAAVPADTAPDPAPVSSA